MAARKRTEKQGAGLQIYRELMELSILCSVYVCAYTTEERKVTSSKRKKLLLFVQRNEVLFKETRPEKFCAALALAACVTPLKFKWKFE